MMRFITVRVDTDELLGDIDTKTLIAAARDRDFEPQSRESAITAIAQIRDGKHDDAIVTLERAFLPAWEDAAACEARYREVMGRAS
jgi:hypothetical protein